MSEQPKKEGERDYQDRDIRLGPILKFAAGAAVFTALVFAGMWRLFDDLSYHSEQRDAAAATRFSAATNAPPAPLLQVNEKRTLQEQKDFERGQLTTYAWIDKPAGVVRLPVERAMALVVERGLPVRPAGAGK